jgi:hypothetical protein
MTVAPKAAGQEVERRLDAVGWGLLFLLTGVLLLVVVPEGTWLAGVGAILLGVSAAKAVLHATVSWFIVLLGMVALMTGIGEMAGIDVPGLPLLLILCGVVLIGAQVFRRGQA